MPLLVILGETLANANFDATRARLAEADGKDSIERDRARRVPRLESMAVIGMSEHSRFRNLDSGRLKEYNILKEAK